MASFSSTALAGRRIAVTRAREQAPELSTRLSSLGAEVIELPLIHVSKEISKESLADVLLELGGYDWIVFTSANGVRYFFEEFFRIFDDIRSLGLLRIACVGAMTAKAVLDLHLKVEAQPKTPSADALAGELIDTGSLDSAKILVITGNLNRDSLVKKLEEARAIVDCLQVYRTEKTDISADPATADFRARGADAILFASSSAAESFADQSSEIKLIKGATKPLAGSIGPQTSETMRQLKMTVDFEAKHASLDELVAATVAALAMK